MQLMLISMLDVDSKRIACKLNLQQNVNNSGFNACCYYMSKKRAHNLMQSHTIYLRIHSIQQARKQATRSFFHLQCTTIILNQWINKNDTQQRAHRENFTDLKWYASQVCVCVSLQLNYEPTNLISLQMTTTSVDISS